MPTLLPVRSREAFANLRRTSLVPGTPAVLRNYSFVSGDVMSSLHCPALHKLRFEELRGALRAALGFPVTQPGAVAAMVEFVAARRAEFVAEAEVSVRPEVSAPGS